MAHFLRHPDRRCLPDSLHSTAARKLKMFFAILFLTLTLSGAYFFPDWSWGSIALAAFACVAALRLALLVLAKRQSGDRQ